jgi:HEAT repeat protein
LPLLSKGTAWPVRLAALRSLSHFRRADMAPDVEGAWLAAIRALEGVAAGDEFALAREAAAQALFALAGEEAVPTLQRLAKSDAEARVRATASHLLAQLRPTK